MTIPTLLYKIIPASLFSRHTKQQFVKIIKHDIYFVVCFKTTVMQEKKVFFKVRSALMMKDEYVVKRHPDASFTPSDKFNDMIIESDERFRAAVLTFIDNVVTDEWAVRFTPFTEEKYDVRVFCNTDDDFKKIRKVILERLPHEKFQAFIKEGSVADIGNLW